MPRPMVWLSEWRRLRGDDLETFDDLALQRERRCVQRRLDYDRDAARRAWLTDRLAAIDRERGSRRAATAREHIPRPAVPHREQRASASGTDAPGVFEYRRGQIVER